MVGITSNTAPWELVRAAGFFPVLLSARHGPTPHADRFMEPIFESRIRNLFDRVLAGEAAFLKLLILPRTSEQEYKLYLYLCEVARQKLGGPIPRLCLFDMLHTRSHRIYRYGKERTRELAHQLSGLAGRPIDTDALAAAIQESNDARAAIRRLLELRRGPEPRLTGTEALQLIGAWYFMERAEYAQLARTAAGLIAHRKPLGGRRVMVKGSCLDHTGLHRAIESHGAVVVAEDDWWGSRSAGRDVKIGRDLVRSIFAKYYLDSPSPRVFPTEYAERWFRHEALRDIDGVVFYLPPDEDVLGWDYPRQKAFLEEHNIPSVLVREEVDAEATPELHDKLDMFITGLKRTEPQKGSQRI